MFRAWQTAVGFGPIVATVATLAPIAAVAHVGAGFVVLGAAVCLSARHRAETGPTRVLSAATVTRVVTTTVGVAVLALVFSRSLIAGDALFVGVLVLSRLVGRYGPRWAAFGRAMLLPLTALFIAPPVVTGDNPLTALAWAVCACVVAAFWTTVFPAVLPRPRPRTGAVARAARQAVRLDPGPAAGRRSRILATAALDLDQRLAGDAAARRALFEVECAVDRARASVGPSGEVDAALAALDQAVGRWRPAAPDHEPLDPRDAPSHRTRTRLALQSALAVSLAFLIGQTVFPDHWPWTVITVITVSFAARSRGEVLVKSGQRLAGALAATAIATPLASAAAARPGLTVVAILTILGVGMYLREVNYTWWAMAMTAALAFLYALTGQTGGAALLGERLIAICVGAGCAVVPALYLAPRTRDLVRKRTATSLRRLRDCLDPARIPDVGTVRRLDTAVADLRTAAGPLRLVPRLRAGTEAGWVDAFGDCAPSVRQLVCEPERGSAIELRRVLARVATEVRAERSTPS
jgi:hypothetical protein